MQNTYLKKEFTYLYGKWTSLFLSHTSKLGKLRRECFQPIQNVEPTLTPLRYQNMVREFKYFIGLVFKKTKLIKNRPC